MRIVKRDDTVRGIQKFLSLTYLQIRSVNEQTFILHRTCRFRQCIIYNLVPTKKYFWQPPSFCMHVWRSFAVSVFVILL